MHQPQMVLTFELEISFNNQAINQNLAESVKNLASRVEREKQDLAGITH